MINSRIKFPLIKKWQLDTDQNVDDENHTPKPYWFKIYLLNNKGYLFKINAEKVKLNGKKYFQRFRRHYNWNTSHFWFKKYDNTIALFAHNGSGELLAINGDNEKLEKRRHSI